MILDAVIFIFCFIIIFIFVKCFSITTTQMAGCQNKPHFQMIIVWRFLCLNSASTKAGFLVFSFLKEMPAAIKEILPGPLIALYGFECFNVIGPVHKLAPHHQQHRRDRRPHHRLHGPLLVRRVEGEA